MTNNLFNDTVKGIKRERPPVWFMRQAGRVLPEYLKLREKYSFRELMTEPELTAEVTLQPVRSLGVDAAILFSDILVIPEGLGMSLKFTDKGPVFDSPLKLMPDSVNELMPNPSSLEHIYTAIDIIKKQKPAETALIGFCGAPFTTFCYMVEGSSQKHDFAAAVNLLYTDRKKAEIILEKITDLSIEYAVNQARHGIDAFQLFDTHAGLIPSDLYFSVILPYVKKITNAVRSKNIPVIFFPKGLGLGISKINKDVTDFVSIDWQNNIAEARKIIDPNVGLQGNFDMRILSADDRKIIDSELEKFILFGRENYNWIFNTGHGLNPDNKFENVKYLVEKIKSADWMRS